MVSGMPMQITTPDGRVLYIRTHVGDGLTVIETWEEDQPAPLGSWGSPENYEAWLARFPELPGKDQP